jgi:hypothetical protein
MPSSYPSTALQIAASTNRTSLLPVKVSYPDLPTVCVQCRFINENDHNFCTNCGYPTHANTDQLALYNFRHNARKKLLQRTNRKIAAARNVLYIAATFCGLGISFFFSGERSAYVKGAIMMMLMSLFIWLGRWSTTRPFTSLLISFLIMITLVAINTWAQFTQLFTTATGVYVLFAQLVLLYYLTEGVKAAYQADVLTEEFNF